LRPLPTPPLFPYTTLFRSDGYARLTQGDVFFNQGLFSPLYIVRQLKAIFLEPPDIVPGTPFFFRPRFTGMSLFLTTPAFIWVFRSEEHTSELQSRGHLVCR